MMLIMKNQKAEMHIQKLELKENFILHEEKQQEVLDQLAQSFGTTVGSVAAEGTVGVTLFKDGKFTPQANVKVGAEATALNVNGSARFGNEKFNGHVATDANVGRASAEASAVIGVIEEKDKKTGKIKKEYGVKGKVGAEACLAEGTISGGFTVFGVKVDVGFSAKAGSVGATAEGKITNNGFHTKGSLSAIFGAGLDIGVDWSDFSLV